MDNSDAQNDFGWSPACGLEDILTQIAEHAQRNPDWLERSGA
jgi:hypothetical protein